MSRVRRLARVRLDPVKAIADLAGRSEDAARRFRREAEATFIRLADMPGMGARFETNEPAYAQLRFFPISRFRNYLVFDRPLADGIEVVRVLHGARDIGAVSAEDFGVEAEEP